MSDKRCPHCKVGFLIDANLRFHTCAEGDVKELRARLAREVEEHEDTAKTLDEVTARLALHEAVTEAAQSFISKAAHCDDTISVQLAFELLALKRAADAATDHSP